MITDRPRRFRLTLFAAVYFAEGAIGAFSGNFMKPYLSDFGVDADLIGLLFALSSLPAVIKIFYGLLSDRVNPWGLGHRVPYMAIGLVVSTLPILALGFVNPGTHFVLYVALAVSVSFAITLCDTTTDGLAVDITPQSEQAQLQSTVGSALAISTILMSLLIGWIAAAWGYFWVYIIVAVIVSLPLYWVLRVREPPRDLTRTVFEWRAFRTLIQPAYLIFAAYGILAWVAQAGTAGIVTFYMRSQLNALETDIGAYGALEAIGELLGILATNWLAGRWGRRTCLILAGAVLSLGSLGFSCATSVTAVLALGFVWGLVTGLSVTIYRVLSMARADPRIAGSMFAINLAVGNLGTAIGVGVGTSLTDDIGFVNVFRLAALADLLVLPLVVAVFRSAGQMQQPPVMPPPAAPSEIDDRP